MTDDIEHDDEIDPEEQEEHFALASELASKGVLATEFDDESGQLGYRVTEFGEFEYEPESLDEAHMLLFFIRGLYRAAKGKLEGK